jgi:FkbM family methyltransferase
MTTKIIDSAKGKTWAERMHAAQFMLRRGMAKLSYLPVPLHLELSEKESIDFWWSYVVPFYDPSRGFFDYWGHDLPELRFIWRMLKPGMVFLDIGAYHGIYSLVAGRRTGRTGKIVAFEPSPREFSRLQRHLRWNRIANARAERVAVGADAGEQTFFQVSSGDQTRNGLRPPGSRDELKEIAVRTISLDQYIEAISLERIDVVKLDVEGGELDVLRGAASLLNGFRPVFICEVLDAATQPWGYEAREIVSAFSQHDMVWFDFQPGGTLTLHKIQDLYPDIRNYLAVPREKLAEIAEWTAP